MSCISLSVSLFLIDGLFPSMSVEPFLGGEKKVSQWKGNNMEKNNGELHNRTSTSQQTDNKHDNSYRNIVARCKLK